MNCRQAYAPNQEEINEIVKLFNLKQGQTFAHIHELELQAMQQKVGGDTPIGTSEQTIMQLWRANPEGCDECGRTGFKGRVGIYEVLDISRAVQKMITENATSDEIQDQAISEGMITMQADGLVKTLRGNTTLDEVLRVTRES